MGNKIAIGLSSYQFMAMARRGLFYTFLSLYLMQFLGLSVTETTLLASLSMITNSLSQTFVWGKISDKYRMRASLVIIGETTAALGYLLVYFLHAHLMNTIGSVAAGYTIIAGLTILEFFWSMSNLGWSALISDLSTSGERGKLMSVISSVGGVGRIAGISVSGALYNWGGEAGGFKNGILFYFAAGIMLASVVLIWFSTRGSEPTVQREPTDGILEQEKQSSDDHNSQAFYWFLASIFIVGLGTFSILQILTFYVALEAPIGADSIDMTMIFNAASIATILASLVAGPLADKIGAKNALGLGLSLTVITPILYIFAQDVTQMIIINSLSGISTAFINVIGYLLASNLIPPERRGRLFGRYNAVSYISLGIAGTIIGGPIADYLISIGTAQAAAYVTTFQVASAISLMGVLIFLLRVKSDKFDTRFKRSN